MKVGDKLWCVSNRNHGYRKTEEVTVTKVGRTWVYLSNELRINPKTMWADGGQYSSPAVCYPSKEIWQDEKEASRVMSLIRDQIGFGKPTVNAETAHKIAELLGIKIKEQPNE